MMKSENSKKTLSVTFWLWWNTWSILKVLSKIWLMEMTLIFLYTVTFKFLNGCFFTLSLKKEKWIQSLIFMRSFLRTKRKLLIKSLKF